MAYIHNPSGLAGITIGSFTGRAISLSGFHGDLELMHWGFSSITKPM